MSKTYCNSDAVEICVNSFLHIKRIALARGENYFAVKFSRNLRGSDRGSGQTRQETLTARAPPEPKMVKEDGFLCVAFKRWNCRKG